jgi:ketol-acid reductoisomerase
MTKIFFDEDGQLELFEGKVLAVLGYGNQGRSQALNLRDGGFNVIVGNREDEYAAQALADGFEVLTLTEAAKQGDVLQILVADEVQPDVYANQITPGIQSGNTLVFSSGFNIYYGFIKPQKDVDVIMVAPEMIGLGVRENFLDESGFPCLIGVEQDATGQALAIAVALAKAIGSTKMGAVMSSFEEETFIDLMYEHSGILYHIRRIISVLIEAGVSPEAAIIGFYASGEEARLAQAYANIGLWHQLPLHSRTSQYGQEITSKLSPEEEESDLDGMRKTLENIRNGTFAKDWMLEQQAGFPTWRRARRENLNHPVIRAERDLFRRLGRLSEYKDDDPMDVGIE